MSVRRKHGSPLPASDEVLIPISPDVDLDGVSLELLQFALKLAYVHLLLFDLPLQVTRARGLAPCDGVAHESGMGLDVRMNDLSPDEGEVFVAVTDYLAMQYRIQRAAACVEDEFKSMHLERKLTEPGA
jgi:hypothetical protein